MLRLTSCALAFILPTVAMAQTAPRGAPIPYRAHSTRLGLPTPRVHFGPSANGATPRPTRMTSTSQTDSSSGGARGAKRGFLIGAALGFASVYLICDGASCRDSPGRRFRHGLSAAAVDGAVGALIGWKIGSR